MKKITCLLLVLFFIVIAGCAKNSAEKGERTLTYRDEKYGFELTFPSDWKDKYSVEYNYNTVVIGHKATFEKMGSGTGGLFYIFAYIPKELWETEGKADADMIGMQKIYEGEDEIFGYSRPTDVQYDFNDKELSSGYKEMEKDVPDIIKTFKKVE